MTRRTRTFTLACGLPVTVTTVRNPALRREQQADLARACAAPEITPTVPSARQEQSAKTNAAD